MRVCLAVRFFSSICLRAWRRVWATYQAYPEVQIAPWCATLWHVVRWTSAGRLRSLRSRSWPSSERRRSDHLHSSAGQTAPRTRSYDGAWTQASKYYWPTSIASTHLSRRIILLQRPRNTLESSSKCPWASNHSSWKQDRPSSSLTATRSCRHRTCPSSYRHHQRASRCT